MLAVVTSLGGERSGCLVSLPWRLLAVFLAGLSAGGASEAVFLLLLRKGCKFKNVLLNPLCYWCWWHCPPPPPPGWPTVHIRGSKVTPYIRESKPYIRGSHKK